MKCAWTGTKCNELSELMEIWTEQHMLFNGGMGGMTGMTGMTGMSGMGGMFPNPAYQPGQTVSPNGYPMLTQTNPNSKTPRPVWTQNCEAVTSEYECHLALSGIPQ